MTEIDTHAGIINDAGAAEGKFSNDLCEKIVWECQDGGDDAAKLIFSVLTAAYWSGARLPGETLQSVLDNVLETSQDIQAKLVDDARDRAMIARVADETMGDVAEEAEMNEPSDK